MEAGAWEDDIDLDDSDLPSLHLLRPCSTSHSQPPPPTPPPQKRHRHVIPGPAGAVQEAMRRQAAIASRGDGGAVLNALAVEDAVFKLNPWLCALDFVEDRRSSARPSPINTIKTSRTAHRVEMVLGIVSSCRSNGLGGLFVTLKDPTGTIGAFIHHKVLMDPCFGSGGLSVGCVLILKKVVVFPIRSSTYLNVTLNNMVKVINKDCGPPQRSAMISIASGKGMETRNAPENVANSLPLQENFANFGSDREQVTVGSTTESETFLEELPKKAADEVIMNQVSKVSHQQPNEILMCASKGLDVTIGTQSDEARTALVAEAVRSSQNLVTTYSTRLEATKAAGRLLSEARASFSAASDRITTVASSKSRLGTGVHTQEDMEVRVPLPENGTSVKGPVRSLPSGNTGVPTTSFVMLEDSTKHKEPETLISKDSVIGWTDEQIQNLFCDYQDTDDMNMFLS